MNNNNNDAVRELNTMVEVINDAIVITVSHIRGTRVLLTPWIVYINICARDSESFDGNILIHAGYDDEDGTPTDLYQIDVSPDGTEISIFHQGERLYGISNFYLSVNKLGIIKNNTEQVMTYLV